MFFIIPILLLLLSCNQNQSTNSNSDSVNNDRTKDTLLGKTQEKADSISYVGDDNSFIRLSDSILMLLENKDYYRLSRFIHPRSGIRFSPYGFVDTLKNQKLSAKQLKELIKSKKAINWGTFQGSGEPIILSVNDYLERFAYDVDFLNADKKSINKIFGADSASSNIASIYPDCNFVQFYFPGFKKQYEGMDWKSLVLVFKKEDARAFLVGIIHDEWKG